MMARDMISLCRFGEVQHIHVDKNSNGFVYVRFAHQQGAEAAHRALNLRWYSGKQVRSFHRVSFLPGVVMGKQVHSPILSTISVVRYMGTGYR